MLKHSLAEAKHVDLNIDTQSPGMYRAQVITRLDQPRTHTEEQNILPCIYDSTAYYAVPILINKMNYKSYYKSTAAR